MHRFAVVRVGVRRRIVNALDLIVRRGAAPFPENEPKQGKPEAKNHKPGSEGPKVLLHNPTLADPQIWVLPGTCPRIKLQDTFPNQNPRLRLDLRRLPQS